MVGPELSRSAWLETVNGESMTVEAPTVETSRKSKELVRGQRSRASGRRKRPSLDPATRRAVCGRVTTTEAQRCQTTDFERIHDGEQDHGVPDEVGREVHDLSREELKTRMGTYGVQSLAKTRAAVRAGGPVTCQSSRWQQSASDSHQIFISWSGITSPLVLGEDSVEY
ncbi:hypothetical protein BJX62DRAFT_101114 [Aspergillus germanicus]